MPDNSSLYSIVVPVYDSTESVIELVARLQKVFKETIMESYEIILIDDKSPNSQTWDILNDMARKYKEVKIVQLMRNFGKQGAMMCGFDQANGKYIITMDDDLQHLPEDIPKLIAYQDHDVVIGNFKNKKHSIFKKTASSIKGWFDYKLIGKPRHLKVGPFKLFNSQVVENMIGIKTPYPFIPALMFYVTTDVVNVEVDHGLRKYGRSNFTLRKMLKLFSNLLINNSSFVLRKIALIGIYMSVINFGLGIFFILKRIMVGSNISGWTSLMVVSLFTSGLILFSVGIVGEYLIRIINGIENRPPFIIRNQNLQSDNPPDEN